MQRRLWGVICVLLLVGGIGFGPRIWEVVAYERQSELVAKRIHSPRSRGVMITQTGPIGPHADAISWTWGRPKRWDWLPGPAHRDIRRAMCTPRYLDVPRRSIRSLIRGWDLQELSVNGEVVDVRDHPPWFHEEEVRELAHKQE